MHTQHTPTQQPAIAASVMAKAAHDAAYRFSQYIRQCRPEEERAALDRPSYEFMYHAVLNALHNPATIASPAAVAQAAAAVGSEMQKRYSNENLETIARNIANVEMQRYATSKLTES